jgi:hypothetical protein
MADFSATIRKSWGAETNCMLLFLLSDFPTAARWQAQRACYK